MFSGALLEGVDGRWVIPVRLEDGLTQMSRDFSRTAQQPLLHPLLSWEHLPVGFSSQTRLPLSEVWKALAGHSCWAQARCGVCRSVRLMQCGTKTPPALPTGAGVEVAGTADGV
ncbi:28S ribosomal protein S35, mitochondrial [Platysternon megacephalum]|uniref:28S ribosomal protein S35, mitochondrial n=1 Tax=Platysternon megacephalum TaxID=55544 RepID=A0A4D9EFH5_9SAUR|nr:28S ribosomal protein S35, mitochondrial [Platysternon megacephalum]